MLTKRSELKLDGHKLLYHLEELKRWAGGEDFYPVYIELGPTTVCNQRCVHCYIRYLGFKIVSLDKGVMLKFIRDAASLGVKALCFAGTGEPFLHKATPEAIRLAKRSGLDVAVATNGIPFTKVIAAKVLPELTWIRFSVLGGSKDTYKKLQGAKEGDWEKLLANLKDAVAIKRARRLAVTLGVVFFIFRANGHEVVRLARLLKKIGVDYLVIKPVGDYQKNRFRAEKDLQVIFEKELRAAEKLSTAKYKVQVRWDMFQKWGSKPYKKCLSLPFMTVIDADGGVYACGGYWQDKRYLYGNLNRHSFKEIWGSAKRKRTMKWMEDHVDFKDCYNCCRNHSINSFLWGLTQKPAHVNFI